MRHSDPLRSWKPHLNFDLYKAVRRLGAPFRSRLIGWENVGSAGPALFIANHQGSLGPIQCILSLNIRLYPWVIAEMTDLRRAPAYLYEDFIRPAWRLEGQVGRAVSRPIAWAAVKLINGIGSIPVDKNGGWTGEAYRRTLDVLGQGKSVLIFPEDPAAALDPELMMRQFQCGFVGVCRMYQGLYSKPLPVYPLAVHPGSRTIIIGQAAYYAEDGRRKPAIEHFCGQIEGELHRLYRSLAG